MILELPFISDTQSFTAQLGSVSCRFEAKYNDRSGAWTFDLYDGTTQALIVASIPMVLGQDLLEPYTLGLGSIICIDNSGLGIDAGPDDLGVRVKMNWISPDEVIP